MKVQNEHISREKVNLKEEEQEKEIAN